jgi:hypothetical protein
MAAGWYRIYFTCSRHANPARIPVSVNADWYHRQGVLADRFNEPVAESFGNPKNIIDNPLGHRLQKPSISFIPLHPAHPP